MLHYPIPHLLTLVDVEGFFQIIGIPSHGLIANADVDFIFRVWWKMQQNIVGWHVVVQSVAMVDIVYSIQECLRQFVAILPKHLHMPRGIKLLLVVIVEVDKDRRLKYDVDTLTII